MTELLLGLNSDFLRLARIRFFSSDISPALETLNPELNLEKLLLNLSGDTSILAGWSCSIEARFFACYVCVPKVT